MQRARRQEDRVRDAAEKQHWRHVLPVDAHPEVQAQLRAVPWLNCSDDLAARDNIAR
jgi:hypothetical protein